MAKSRYLQNISTSLFCNAEIMSRTIIMQNFRLIQACFSIKIDEVWINKFCIRYDWWRRLQPTSSVSPCDYGKLATPTKSPEWNRDFLEQRWHWSNNKSLTTEQKTLNRSKWNLNKGKAADLDGIKAEKFAGRMRPTSITAKSALHGNDPDRTYGWCDEN